MKREKELFNQSCLQLEIFLNVFKDAMSIPAKEATVFFTGKSF
jgi:hypothetical protein